MSKGEIGLQIEGQKKLALLARNMASQNIDGDLSKAIKEGAFIGERAIKIGITKMDAVDTGFMRSSVRITQLKTGRGAFAKIGPLADYAIYVHEGTRNMRVRRFIPYGVELEKEKFDSLMKRTGLKISTSIVKGV